MRSSFFLSSALVISLLSTACTDQNTESESYREYPFDSGDDVDMGFTQRELDRLIEDQTLLSENSTAIETQEMTHVETTEKDMAEGITDQYEWNGDIYGTKSELGDNNAGGNYVLTKNGEVIFEGPMAFSPLGAVIDWRVVEDKPALTFNAKEMVNDQNQVTYTQDIWYNGALISETYSVEDARYLFSYNGKLGFVANDNGTDKIFYNGEFITPGFTQIWTANCCSYTEILPIVYENGTLLFYALQDEQTYLVEVHLE